MSYALSDTPSAVRRHHTTSIAPDSSPSEIQSLRDRQQEEFPHLDFDSLSLIRPTPRPPPPNYSIQPSTVNLEASCVEPHLDTFPRFKDLPTELRIKIYKYACLEPRAVPIWPVIVNRTSDEVEFRFQSEIPAIMQVSREARQETQKLDIYAPPDTFFGTSPRVWIKPGIDIICPVRNGRTMWTEDQYSKFAAIIVHMKIERLGFVLQHRFNYKSADDYDKWECFDDSPVWMSQNIRQIFLYTSLNRFNIRYQPLQLVKNAENYPKQYLEKLAAATYRTNYTFVSWDSVMCHYEFYLGVQDHCDEMYERWGLKKRKILTSMPQWLYDHRRTWTRPEFISLSAL